jgi:hypothetical protein
MMMPDTLTTDYRARIVRVRLAAGVTIGEPAARP